MHHDSTFRKIIKTFFYLVVFLFLISLLSVALFTFSGDSAQRWVLSRAVEGVTGGELALGGAFRLHLGKRIDLAAEKVELGKSARGPVRHFQARRLRLSFPLTPLLFHRRLELDYHQEGGEIRFAGRASESEGSPILAVVPEHVSLDGVTFRWSQGRGPGKALRIARLELRGGGGTTLRLDGRYQGQPLKMHTRLDGGRVKMEGRIGALKLSAEGSAERGEAALRLRVRGRAPTLRFLQGSPLATLPDLGPLELQGDLLLGKGVRRGERLRIRVGEGKRLQLTAKGRMDDLLTGKGLRLAMEGHSGSFRSLLQRLGIPSSLPFAEMEMSAELAGRYHALRVSDFHLRLRGKGVRVQARGGATQIGEPRRLALHLEGTVERGKRAARFSLGLDGARGDRRPLELRLSGEGVELESRGHVAWRSGDAVVEGRITATAEHLARLSPWLGIGFEPVKPVGLQGHFHYGKRRLRLGIERLQVGESDLQGEVNLALRPGRRPLLEGRLRSERWNVFGRLSRRKRLYVRLVEKEELPPEPVKEAARPRLFSRRPLPLRWLSWVDGRLALQVENLEAGTVRLQQLSGTLRLEDGKMRLQEVRGRIGGAPLQGALELDGAADPPRLSLRIRFAGADLANAFPGFGLPPNSGTVGLSLQARAAGRTPAAMAASLDGEARLSLHDASFHLGLPPSLEAALLQRLNPETKKKPAARRMQCAALYLKAEQGVVRAPRGAVVVFPRVVWVGEGVANLADETLEATLEPKASGLLDLSLSRLADLVAVRGPLLEPLIVINPTGALRTSLSYAAAVQTGGLSLLLEGLIQKITQEKDPCGYVLAETGKSAKE